MKNTLKDIIITLPIMAVCSALGASVTLAWDANYAEYVTNYNIYVGTSSGSYQRTELVGNVTNATVGDLTPGATYYFVATALGNGLESDPSNEISYQVPIDTPFHFPLDPINAFIDANWPASFITNSLNDYAPNCLLACSGLDLWNEDTGDNLNPSAVQAGDRIWAVAYMPAGFANQPLDFLVTRHVTIPK